MITLHFISSLSGGGAERQLGYLAPALARRGHQVHIAYRNEGPRPTPLPGVTLHRLPFRSPYDPFLLWRAERLVRQIGPQIIQTWIQPMDILGGIVARRCRIPWVFREPSSSKAYAQATWKQRLRVWVASGASAVISNSQGGDAYWKAYGRPSRRYVLPNGLPMEEIDEVPASFPVGVPQTQDPMILYVGRLSSDISAVKNLKPLLEAIASVRQKKKILGVLCGDGPQRSELEKVRHRLGLDEDVHFTGYLPALSVWALMKKCAVFVSLSAYEGCPNAVMEAMACGCPLILSDIPAHRELLQGGAAFFVDPVSVDQVARAMLDVLDDPVAERQKALQAQARVRSWSVARMAQKYEEIYEEVARS